VPTRAGSVLRSQDFFRGVRWINVRWSSGTNVLVYTYAALKQNLEVTRTDPDGFLYASTTATDTDFTPKLVDVFPSGGRAISPTAFYAFDIGMPG